MTTPASKVSSIAAQETRDDSNRATAKYKQALRRLIEQAGQPWFISESESTTITWTNFTPVSRRLPDQGWKIHVTSAATEAEALLSNVLPRLIDLEVAFKLPTSLSDLLLLNNGGGGNTQVGKIVTIYPEDDQQLVSVVEVLRKFWSHSVGPAIPNDLVVKPGLPIFLRFGTFFSRRTVVDSKGFYFQAVVAPDGSWVADSREARPPLWAGNPPVDCLPQHEDDLAQIAVGSSNYYAVALLHRSPKGTVHLAINSEDARTVILKSAFRGVGGDVAGTDSVDKLYHEYDILRAIDESAIAPRALDIQRSPTGAVLVLEDVGESPDVTQIIEPLHYLAEIADAVARLHALGYAHNDIKMSNVAHDGASLRLLDFELSGQLGGQIFGLGGTRNYYALEEWEQNIVGASRDVYALGICVAHALTGTDPATLPYGPGRLLQILKEAGATAAARVVARLCLTSASDRPTARQAASIIRAESVDRASLESPARLLSPNQNRARRWAVRASIDAARSTRRYVTTSPDALSSTWRNSHISSSFLCEGINIGAAGVCLGLTAISTALRRAEFDDDIIAGAKWLAERPPTRTCAGLFTGDAGVATVLSLVACRHADGAIGKSARERLECAAQQASGFDLFNGKAGVVYAACLISTMVRDEWPLTLVRGLLDELLDCRERSPNGAFVWREEGDADPWLTGAAHGSSGVAMALAVASRATRDEVAGHAALATLKSIYECCKDEAGATLLHSVGPSSDRTDNGTWCHGAAGYLWCMLLAFGDDPRLRQEIDWAVKAFASVIPVRNPTYCHGLAGQLELWRMVSGIERHRRVATARAAQVANVLRACHQRVGPTCVWTSESADVVTPDLWVGFMGPASALALYAAHSTDALLSSAWMLMSSAR